MSRNIGTTHRTNSTRCVSLQKPQIVIQPTGRCQLVVIQKKHVRSRCFCKTRISGTSDAKPGFVFVPHPAILLLKAPHCCVGSVSRAIVDDQQFCLRGELRQHALRCFEQTLAAITRADRDRNERRRCRGAQRIGWIVQIVRANQCFPLCKKVCTCSL